MGFGEGLKNFGQIEYDIQPGETLSAGIGAEIRYDERSPEVVEGYFDTGSEPGDEILDHFKQGRKNYHDLDETVISFDENGNPFFSDLVEEQIGECLEMALVGLSYVQNDVEETYLVNGSLPDTDNLGFLSPEHAYLILEDGGSYEVFDPATLLDGEPVRAEIVGIGDFNTLNLEEGVQQELESSFGQKYALE